MITTLTDAGIHHFEDVEGCSPEEFNHFKELACEFLDKGKGKGKGQLALQVLLDSFKALDPISSTNVKILSKDFLRDYYIGKESEILEKQEVLRDTDC